VSADAQRFAVWGFFGMGNIGNEGTLAAFLRYMREMHPEAVLSCFAGDAEAAEREHGVPAAQLMSFRANPSRDGPMIKVAKAASRVWDLPRTFKMMGHVDVLVVPGTGVLETKLMPTPWGLPYWLFVATLSCRLRGGRVVLVSIGAEYPTHPVTRWLYRWILRLSHYRSFRDEESCNAMNSIGGTGQLDAVVPDLTFAMPTPDNYWVRPGHVAIGVMSYIGTSDDPNRGAGVRGRYVECMTRLVTRLVDEGRTVTLFIGDVHDQPVAVEIERSVRKARRELGSDAVAVSTASTLEEIMAEMAEAELVVASRFHNVICALKLAKPIVSLGYAGKNADLLKEFGLGEFAQPIDAFDVDRLSDQMAEVRGRKASVESHMRDILQKYADSLDEQFRRLSCEFFSVAPERRGWGRGTPE
jgi:polysaccharide pyruvyl transferase WcaK-like protein